MFSRSYYQYIARHFLGDLKTLWLLATVSLSIGLLLNQFRDQRLPFVYQSKSKRMEKTASKLAAESARTPAVLTESVTFVSLEDFQNLSTQQNALILDARPEIFHRFGHIPKALALPRDDFETFYRKLQSQLEADKRRLLLVYCSSEACEDSALVAQALKRLGFSQVAIFKGGWSKWTENHLPEEHS